MTKKEKHVQKIRNIVAKHMEEFCRAVIERDKKKDYVRAKQKREWRKEL